MGKHSPAIGWGVERSWGCGHTLHSSASDIHCLILLHHTAQQEPRINTILLGVLYMAAEGLLGLAGLPFALEKFREARERVSASV